MRFTFAVALAAIVMASESLNAEQADPRKPVIPQLPNQPRLVIRTEDLFPLTPPKRLGVVTLLPPQKNGEVFRVSIPVGELFMKSARAISGARRRSEERKIDERIAREVEALNSRR